MRILIATDAFPPVCGGSGWSTYELAKALRARGHEILVVQPRIGTLGGSRRPADARLGARAGETVEYDGFSPIVVREWAPPVPFVRNYFSNERLYRRLGTRLAALARDRQVDLLHAQHLRTGPAAVLAARAVGRPVICTVRDYWPVCYWSDLLHDRAAASLCPGCSAVMMTRCVRPHAGAGWPLALAAIPYMRGNLARKQRALADADALVAVSAALARDLRARAPVLADRRIDVIPNPVDVATIRAQADAQPRPLASPYAVYAGKLAPNKGVLMLAEALARARLDWPVVIVGDGPERGALERALGALGVRAHFTGWLPRSAALGWMRHAELLIFPSHGPESLSRVLLEASALEVPIAAMDTGGTSEIVVHEETGLLTRSAAGLGDEIARLRHDDALRRRMGEAARRRVERVFDSGVVAARVEALYQELCALRSRR